MNTKVVIDYCNKIAVIKWKTAESLLKSRRYSDCLFFCHLTLELLLKGKVTRVTGNLFPMTHNLLNLALRTKFNLTDKQKNDLKVVNTFNITGRYDDYKLTFYKSITADYAKKYFEITKNLIIWLKKH